MKIAILVAGTSKYFPLLIDKPKCLYHLNGNIQLKKVIDDAREFVKDEDIIVVGGYKYKYIEHFLKKNYPKVVFKVNNLYDKAAIYSFRKAVENECDDFVFMFGDESISKKNISKIVTSKRKLAILCHDTFYYYSLGIIKLRNDVLNIVNDDRYLSMNEIKKIYCFANNKKRYDGAFDINSGICIGYIMIDFVRRIGNIKKIENPIETYIGNDIDFIHYNPREEYIPDLDYFCDTDEYKNNFALRIYADYISTPIKKVIGLSKRVIAKVNKHI